MGLVARIALAVFILVVDFVSFLVPLGAIVLALVILTRPRWFIDFVDHLYEGVDFGAPPASPSTSDPAPEPAPDPPTIDPPRE